MKLRIIILFLLPASISVSLLTGVYGSFIFAFPIPIIWQICIREDSFTALGFRRKLLSRSLAVGGLSGVILGLAGGLLFRLLFSHKVIFPENNLIKLAIVGSKVVFPLSNEIGYRLLRASFTNKGLFLYVMFMIFAVGFGEELFWRGFIQQKIALKLNKQYAILFTGLLFSLFHVYLFTILNIKEGVFLLSLILLAGAFWGYLYECFSNIWAPALSHGIAAFIMWKCLIPS